MTHPGEWPPVDRGAAGHAVDILPIAEGAVRFRRRTLEAANEAAAVGVVRRRAEVRRCVLWVGVPRFPGRAAAAGFATQLRVAGDVAEARLNVDLLRGRDLEVGATAELIAAVGRIRALIVADVAAHEVAQNAGAAARVSHVIADRALAEDRRAAIELLLRDVDRLDVASVRVAPIVDRNAVLPVPEHVLALLRHEGILGAVRLTLLRDDVDDAARRFRSIQRGRGGALEDLDALDLFWVEVVEPRYDA